MGHVVVKYKVTLDQPEDGSPDYEGIASVISDLEEVQEVEIKPCLLYTSPSPRDQRGSRMPSSA